MELFHGIHELGQQMQVFGNVATQPERKQSKSSGKGYFEFRIAEAQRGIDTSPTFYTVRVMKDENPMLDKGDFVKVTGKLKADFYLSREGKPTGTLLIIAFEAISGASCSPRNDNGKNAGNPPGTDTRTGTEKASGAGTGTARRSGRNAAAGIRLV
jgi:single-stranded DNA-binding protein